MLEIVLFTPIFHFPFSFFTYLCILNSIRYVLYEKYHKKAGIFQINLRDSPHVN